MRIASCKELGGNLVGTDVEAGLPNITGTVGSIETGTIKPSGAFKNVPGGQAVSEAYRDRETITFDASKSNSIYGSSTTVQPPAHIVVFWKRIK